MACAGDERSGFQDFVHEGRRCVVFVPQGDPPKEGWPIILYLHSAGERGTDGLKQADYGIGPAVRKRLETFPGLVVFPQADFADGPILETWRAGEPGGRHALSMLEAVENRWPANPTRRAITGWSMGAYGTLSLAAAEPQRWSKVLAISGGGESEWAAPLSRSNVWLVHGAHDQVVPAGESRRMAERLAAAGAASTYTEVPEAEHDLWRVVYENDAVLEWLISPDASAPPDTEINAPPASEETASADQPERPFEPALVISRAISLRLGNDALETLAAGAPDVVDEVGLEGRLERVSDQVQYEGRTFDIGFEDMSYLGQLDWAIMHGLGPGRLRVAFALEDFIVRIGRIDVYDQQDRVTAGPVWVVIGHREPVWMDLEVRPEPAPDGTLRFELLRSEFVIPDHNWYVRPPEQISIEGDLFSEDIVRTAIVGGVYLRRGLIEENILAAVEPILRQVEGKVGFTPLAELVRALWPLPVYEPQMRVLLEEVSTDHHGLSLVFACAVAAERMLPTSADEVPHVTASSPRAEDVERTTDLRAGIAVDVMEHLSAMVAGSDAATLYAADVPGRPFRELDDVAAVSAAIGDAAEVSDVRSRLVLREPFRYSRGTSGEVRSSIVDLAITVPRLSMTVMGQHASEDPGEHWDAVAERSLSIRQPLRLRTQTSLDGPTRLSVVWDAEFSVGVSGRPATDPSEKLAPLFEQGWRRWAGQQQSNQVLPDVAVGRSLLRLEQFVWQGDSLTAEFRPAATVLCNPSERPVSYCIRTEHSRWSEPFTIKPGDEHIFRTGTALQVRETRLWSRFGQLLEHGRYDWSPTPSDAGVHWVRRDRSDSDRPNDAEFTASIEP